MGETSFTASIFAQQSYEARVAADKARMDAFLRKLAEVNARQKFEGTGPECTGENGNTTMTEHFKEHPEILANLGVEVEL